MRKDGKVKKVIVVMSITFVLIALGFIIYSIYVYSFNTKDRFYSSKEDKTNFSVEIGPRTGQTDSWPKILEQNGEKVDYKGTIYDVNINNIGKCTISDWTITIHINGDCYLNNAWCGKFEIHQNPHGKEKVQIVDLRNYKTEDLTIDYTIADPDLLIPLKKGDFITYYPDKESNEYPINCVGDGNISSIEFGMIFYDKNKEALEFKDFNVKYHLKKRYTQSTQFVLLCIAFIIWLLFLNSFIAIGVNMIKTHKRMKQDEHIIKQSIGVFTQFFEAKDTYTSGHSQRVATYSKQIAEKLGLSDDESRQIFYIALMHDCGKCYIPDDILKKPGKLTDEEYEIIKSHTVKGAEMLENFDSIEHMKDGVLYHHERYDGKGYPTGLKGEKIPLISRIICIADSFDAMNSRRCYRNPLTREYIINELEKNSGKQFDPELIKVFMELIKDGEVEVTETN